jgi:hypothetical protein
MREKLRLLVVILAIHVLFLASSVALAQQTVFYGVLVDVKHDRLTVMDRQGHSESYRVTDDTLVTNRDGSNIRIERFRAGTRLSVTAQNGTARLVSVQEVPK